MPLSPADFEYLSALVREGSAIVLEEQKAYLFEARLAPLARREGFDSLEALVRHLRGARADGLHRKVVESMTTNETSFFRDAQPFEALRQAVLPELLKRRAAERRLRVWCAACASGQEPYSVVMLLREHFPELAGWDVRVLATDLSSDVLARARQGRYSQAEVNRGLPARLLVKYFAKQGLEWHLREDVRRQVEYRQLNLAEPWAGVPLQDVIFLRNVLIYFDVEDKRQVLARVRRVLRPDGALFLGGAETTLNLDGEFERVPFARTCWYRVRPRPAAGGGPHD